MDDIFELMDEDRFEMDDEFGALVRKSYRFSTKDVRLNEPLRGELLEASVTGDMEAAAAMPAISDELKVWHDMKPWLFAHPYGEKGTPSAMYHRALGETLDEELAMEYPTEVGSFDKRKYIRLAIRRQMRSLLSDKMSKAFETDRLLAQSAREKQHCYIAAVTEAFVLRLSSGDSTASFMSAETMSGGCGYRIETTQDGCVWARLTSNIELWSYSCCNWLEWKHRSGNRLCIHLYGGLLRAIADVHRARASVLSCCRLSVEVASPGYPQFEDVERCWKWGDKLLKDHGNSAYKSIKIFEALCVGRLIQRANETVIDKDKFFEKMLEEVADHSGPESSNEVRKALTKLENLSDIAQIFGLFRTWSHPLTNTEGGIAAMKKASFVRSTVDVIEAQKVTARTIETLCVNYFRRHGRYPDCTFASYMSDGRHRRYSEVASAVLDHRLPNKNSSHYRRTDWTEIYMRPRRPKGNLINELSLITDKAASLPRSKLSEAFHSRGYIPADDEKRVLLSYIQNDRPSLEEELLSIDEEGLPDEQLVIGVVPKERELKADNPRMFSLMPHRLRSYITGTEALIAQFILEYFPSITMTNSGSMIKNKMLRSTLATRSSVGRNNTTVVSNLDFSKWNARQRSEFVTPAFRFFDQFLGYRNLIARTHDFFSRSVHYRADNIVCPTGAEFDSGRGKWNWVGQYGGNEGLRQKGWTICTVSGIEEVMESQGIRAGLYSQGDNQVLLLEIPKRFKEGESAEIHHTKEARMKTDAALHHLELYFSKLGLPLKPEETWVSSKVFAYSKILFAEGREMPQSMKRATRAYFLLNDDVPTVTSQIGSVFAAAVAMMEYDTNPTIAMEIALSETCRAIIWGKRFTPASPFGILRHPVTGRDLRTLTIYDGYRNHRFSFDSMEASELLKDDDAVPYLSELLSMFPSALGGLATSNVSVSLTRGFPDLLSAGSGAIMNYIKENGSSCEKVCDRLLNILDVPLKKTIDPSQLVEDPSSINISRCQQGRNILQLGVSTFLRKSSSIKNKLVKAVMSLEEEEYKEKCEILMKAEPCMPRLMSLIMSADPAGQAKAWTGKIDKTATVQRAARRDAAIEGISIPDAQNIEQKLALADSNMMFYVIWRLSYDRDPKSVFTWRKWRDEKTCSYDWSQGLRMASWQRDDIQGVTVAHPLSFTKLYPVIGGKCEKCKNLDIDSRPAHVHIKVGSSSSSNPEIIFSSRGPCLPYMGSKTQQKTTFTSETVFEYEDCALQNIKKMISVIGWIVDPDSLLSEEIWKRVDTMSNLHRNELLSDLVECMSSLLHRLDDPRTSHHGSPGLSTGPYTWFSLSTNTMKEYSKGTDNRALHFQQLLTYSQALTALDLWARVYHRWVAPPSYHIHITNSLEIPEIKDSRPDLPSGDPTSDPRHLPKYSTHPDIPFLYCDREKVNPRPRVGIRNPLFEKRIADLSPADAETAKESVLGQRAMRLSLVGQEMISTSRVQGGYLEFIWTEFCDPISILNKISWLSCIVVHKLCRSNSIKWLMREDETSIPNRLITYTLQRFHLLKDGFFLPVAGLYSNKTSRIALNSCLYLPMSTSVELSTAETTFWAKQAVLATLAHWATEESSMPPLSLFRTETLDAEVTPIELDINMTSRLIMLNKSEELNYLNTARKFLYGETAARKDLNLSGSNDLKELIISRAPDSIRAHLLNGLPSLRILDTEDNIERQLRTVGRSIRTLRPLHRLDNSSMVVPKNALPSSLDQELEWTSWCDNGETLTLDRTCPCSNMCRGQSISTTAHYKIKEVLSSVKLKTKRPNVAALADGTGGFALALIQLFNPKELWFNTLVDGVDGIPSSHTEVDSPVLESYKIAETTIQGRNMLVDGICDITSPDYWARMVLDTKDNRLDLITIDANWSDNKDKFPYLLLRNLDNIKMCMRNCSSVLIMKFYMTSEPVCKDILCLLVSNFEEVVPVMSSYSAHKSCEVYLLCSGEREQTLKCDESNGLKMGYLPRSWVSLLPKMVGRLRPNPITTESIPLMDLDAKRKMSMEEEIKIRKDIKLASLRLGHSFSMSVSSFLELMDHVYRNFDKIWVSDLNRGTNTQDLPYFTRNNAEELACMIFIYDCIRRDQSYHPMSAFHRNLSRPRLILDRADESKTAVNLNVGHLEGEMLSNWQKVRKDDYSIPMQVFGLPDNLKRSPYMRVWLRRLAGFRCLISGELLLPGVDDVWTYRKPLLNLMEGKFINKFKISSLLHSVSDG